MTGGFVRPRPACPCRGMSIRESTTKFEWKEGMKELIRELLVDHTASSAPCEYLANQVMNDGRWSDLDCPSKAHVKNFVQAHFSKHKQAAEHALRRQGKRSYSGLPLKWLKDEVIHRLQKSKKVPKHEWYTKECAYQEIETGRRLREAGMIKLLHQHYNEHSGDVKRHDGDHVVDVHPVYAERDNVQVLWRGKWYEATVLKCYPNNTWDVQYPLEKSDQDFSTRLPAGLLRSPPAH